MTDKPENPLGPIHLSVAWAARIEGLSEHHVRRRERQGYYPGAYRRDGTGAWLIPIGTITRTIDGTLRHWLNHPTTNLHT